MRPLEQVLVGDIAVCESHAGVSRFVKVYPYIYKVKTLVERLRMYIWRKKRDSRKLIAEYYEDDFA